MAYIIDQIVDRNGHQLPHSLVNYHYCKSDEAWKAFHIVSNSILQLLDRQVGLKKEVLDWHEAVTQLGAPNLIANVEKLGEFYVKLVAALDRRLFLVVDGLDERDDHSRGQVLDLLSNMTQKAPRVKTLCSARHYDRIMDAVGLPRTQFGIPLSSSTLFQTN